MSVSVIIAAAGTGKRAGFNNNKLIEKINNKTVIEITVDKFLNNTNINEIIISYNKNDLMFLTKIYANNNKIKLCEGGKSRSQSIKNALDFVTCDFCLIHDGARPFVTNKIIDNCIDSVKNFGSGICALPVTDTIISAENNKINGTLQRDKLFKVQTPQGFKSEEIKKAYQFLKNDMTDDSSVLLNYGIAPHLFEGDIKNTKLTFKEDYILNKNYFTGNGFDTHKLVIDRKLILGGIEIKNDLGLLGHSDADVLIHAIMDALLSSCGLRDIGFYFNDKDDKFKDISSVLLLKKVLKLINDKNYYINNISAVIIAEKPKLSPYIESIKENLSIILNICKENIGITASTTEKLGFTGRGEGITVLANVMTYTLI